MQAAASAAKEPLRAARKAASLILVYHGFACAARRRGVPPMLARATVQTQSNGNGPGQTLGAGAHNRARFGVRIRVVAIAPDPMGIFFGHVYEGESTPNARPPLGVKNGTG